MPKQLMLPKLAITKQAYESLLMEMSKRKLESFSALIEQLAVELELNRK